MIYLQLFKIENPARTVINNGRQFI